VKPVADDLAGATVAAAGGDGLVDLPGGRDREALDALRECGLVIGLDDQVDMVPLDAHVADAKVLACRGDDRRLAKRQADVAAPKAADVPDDADRDVHGVARVVLGARLVALARALALGLTACTRAPAAVCPEDQLHLPLLHELLPCVCVSLTIATSARARNLISPIIDIRGELQ
jgi:hypothetical protein